jgi:hypothetical protein
MPNQAAKEKELEHIVTRLDQRLAKLQTLDNRFSLLRLCVFLLGLGLVYVVSVVASPPSTSLSAGFATLAFILVVVLHRRLDRWRTKIKLWREMRLNQLSRMRLDWSSLPASPTWASASERPALATDLDLTGPRSLHLLLDLAVSEQGSRRLADWLCQGIPDLDQIRERQALVRELAGMRRFRHRLLLNLRLVSSEPLKGENLLKWLHGESSGARLPVLLLVGSLLVTLNLSLFVLNTLGILEAVWPVTSLAYLAFLSANAGRLRPFLDTIPDLEAELAKFSSLLVYLERYPCPRAPNLARLCAAFRQPDALPSQRLRQVKWLTALVGLRSNVITWLLVNLILPWDFLCAFLSARLQARAAVLFPAWLETWYQLECLCSLAAFADLHPEYVFPEIQMQAEPAFLAQELGHPLIPSAQRVCNDFTLQAPGDVALITGSNMAGKSTFIKTVGINLCLAYCGGPVLAAKLRCLPFRLHTCIRISDSIPDGFSYFYAEVKCLKRLLEALMAEHPYPLLYLIDEIFRGTNNRERLLGSQAYVQKLIGAHGLGLIATHDLELAKLAEQNPRLINYHFRDFIQDGRLDFDFKIRPGPSPTTNALTIMRLEGLPTPLETYQKPS